jgi:DNA-binding MarR family transcriptional regulator
MPDQTRRQRAVSFIIKSRTARSRFFPSNLFSEPAWDMLLKLYAAAIEQRSLSVSALAKTVDVEPSTAARWVHALEKEKLVTRQIVKGKEMVSLSERGWFAMDSYFENMSSGMI